MAFVRMLLLSRMVGYVGCATGSTAFVVRKEKDEVEGSTWATEKERWLYGGKEGGKRGKSFK
jgi:hypothetical protein